ncbi:MAG: hypothetical protein AAGU11_07000 [Syntrophobacteraceae bacterium]
MRVSAGLGNPVMSVTDPNNRTTRFTRNRLGGILTRTDALNHVTSYEYEDDGELLTSITDHLGNGSIFGYDPNGNLDSVTDPLRNPPTTFTYNYRGQMTKRTDAQGNDTLLAYVSAGCSPCNGGGEKLVSVTDPALARTSYAYDYDYPRKLYRTTVTDPLLKTTSSTYDARTRRQVVTDRNGHQLTYAFSPTGKLETITYPDQTQLVNTYNNLDRLTDSQDFLGLTHFGYDDEGRITDHTDSQGFVLSYGYNAVGNLTRITYPDSIRCWQDISLMVI